MKKIGIILLIAALSSFIVTETYAQGYDIKVKINGLKNDTAFLGYHYSDKKFILDTALIDETGQAYFKGDEKLAGGIYLIIFQPKRNYFEVLISDDQVFSVETDTVNFVKNMVIKGSTENNRFIDYHRFMQDLNVRGNSIQERLKANKANKDSTDLINKEMRNIRDETKSYQQKIINDIPKSTFATILRALIDPEVPDPPVDENGKALDSLFSYKYYKAHYFDNIDVSDSCLLRTPFFFPRIDFYFQKLVVNNADSLKKEVDSLLHIAEGNTMMMKSLVGHFSYYFETSKIMGMDEVFVHIGENYYLNNKVETDTAFLRKLGDRVRKIKPNTLGNVAPELKLVSNNGEFISLHQVNAKYTIMAFWEPDCGHCKKMIPKLKAVYDSLHNYNIDVEVYAILTQLDTAKWMDFIRDKDLEWINVYDAYWMTGFKDKYDIYSTPVLYVLDEDKKIIYKRISVESILPALFFKEGRQKEVKDIRAIPDKKEETDIEDSEH